MNGADVIAIIILAAIVIAVAAYLLHWLYRRSTKDVSFVRTGFGGEKVIMGGGALVLPILHDITEVNMNTLRLEVTRAQAVDVVGDPLQALLHLRVAFVGGQDAQAGAEAQQLQVAQPLQVRRQLVARGLHHK